MAVVVAASGTAASHSTPVAGSDSIPDPLEPGWYPDQSIDAGETRSYEIELAEYDVFSMSVVFDEPDDLEVTVYDPDGNAVGETTAGDFHANAELIGTPTSGTYTVEIANYGDDAVVDVNVNHESATIDPAPDPLESGWYLDQQIDAGETLSYEVELTEGSYFDAGAMFDEADALEVTVYDSDGNAVGDRFPGDTYSGVYVPEVSATGTYTVDVENLGSETTFDFNVDYPAGSNDGQEPATDPDPDPVPDPLEPGQYAGQPSESGETLTYDAELTRGDYFLAAVHFDPDDDLEVTVLDPDGNSVGTDHSQDENSVVEVLAIPTDGTYTVEVVNRGDDTTFTLDVHHEVRDVEPVPEPLESGLYGGQPIAADETITYEADLARGDSFVVGTHFDPDAAVDVTVFDPDGNAVGSATDSRGGITVDVDAAETAGTYTVEIANVGDGVTVFDLEVRHETRDPDVVPEPLETGIYADQSIDEGETIRYEAELNRNDIFAVGAAGGDDFEVTVLDPDGKPVGTDVREPGFAGVTVVGADTQGTYTVEIENTGATAFFDLDVFRANAIELEEGVETETIGGHDQHFFVIDLAEGDELSTTLSGEDVSDLELALIDPEFEEAGTVERDGESIETTTTDVDVRGTYVLAVYNGGSDEVTYELETATDVGAETDPDDSEADDSETHDSEADDAGGESGADDGADRTDVEDEAATDDTTSDADGQSGFGFAAALVGLVSIALSLRRNGR